MIICKKTFGRTQSYGGPEGEWHANVPLQISLDSYALVRAPNYGGSLVEADTPCCAVSPLPEPPGVGLLVSESFGPPSTASLSSSTPLGAQSTSQQHPRPSPSLSSSSGAIRSHSTIVASFPSTTTNPTSLS
jgi:hypothetical protein